MLAISIKTVIYTAITINETRAVSAANQPRLSPPPFPCNPEFQPNSNSTKLEPKNTKKMT